MKGLVIGIITLFVGTSALPSISGNFLEENKAWHENLKTNERDNSVSLETRAIETIKQSQIKSLCMNNEIPVWKIGDSWIFELSFFLN